MNRLLTLTCSFVFVLAMHSFVQAAERPTLIATRDPRPDILPHPFYLAHTEYRRAYNRPRFLPGWIAAQIEPTSQEALVWYENLQAGRYDTKHAPPLCKTYYFPKPWEVLQTGPRPDFQPASIPQPADSAARPLPPEAEGTAPTAPEPPPAPLPIPSR